MINKFKYSIYIVLLLMISIFILYISIYYAYKTNRENEVDFLNKWFILNNIDVANTESIIINVSDDVNINLFKIDLEKFLVSELGELKVKSNNITLGEVKINYINFISNKIEYHEFSTKNKKDCFVSLKETDTKYHIETRCYVMSFWNRWNKPMYHNWPFDFFTWKEDWYLNSGQSIYKSYDLSASINKLLTSKSKKTGSESN